MAEVGQSQNLSDVLKYSFFGGLLSLVGNLVSNLFTNRQQIEANKEMSAQNLANQKELMDYQTQIAQDTNTIATQKGHAASAGYSPALLYGNMSTPGLMDSASGTNTGEAPNLDKLKLFDKLPVDSVANVALQRHQQELLRAQTMSNINLQNQQRLKAAAETAEQLRYTGLQKRLERTIVDMSLAELHTEQERAENLRFQTRRGNILLPGELESQGLINRETAAKISKINSDISKNFVEMAQIRATTALLGSEKIKTDKEVEEVQERIRGNVVGRVMREFGLAARKTPQWIRKSKDIDLSRLNEFQYGEQMRGAAATLISLGFSEYEASRAVIYYTCESPKDATPSIINGFARILSKK